MKDAFTIPETDCIAESLFPAPVETSGSHAKEAETGCTPLETLPAFLNSAERRDVDQDLYLQQSLNGLQLAWPSMRGQQQWLGLWLSRCFGFGIGLDLLVQVRA